MGVLLGVGCKNTQKLGDGHTKAGIGDGTDLIKMHSNKIRIGQTFLEKQPVGSEGEKKLIDFKKRIGSM